MCKSFKLEQTAPCQDHRLVLFNCWKDYNSLGVASTVDARAYREYASPSVPMDTFGEGWAIGKIWIVHVRGSAESRPRGIWHITC